MEVKTTIKPGEIEGTIEMTVPESYLPGGSTQGVEM